METILKTLACPSALTPAREVPLRHTAAPVEYLVLGTLLHLDERPVEAAEEGVAGRVRDGVEAIQSALTCLLVAY